jgi:ABC-type multidrug transport system ATPase subunit
MIEAFRVGAVSRNGTLWDGLDMAVDDGEVGVITGPPACGKTLLLRILRGDRRPDAGDVVVGGESLYRGNPESARRFQASSGVIPESFPAGHGRSVRDLFRLSSVAGAAISPRERREREEELLSLVGLPGARDVGLPSLSVSERARVSLAVELFRGPKFLFADLLLHNAGREWMDVLGGLFRALAREGRTVLLAERTIPERWKAMGGGEGIAKGPFRLFRLAARGEGPR